MLITDKVKAKSKDIIKNNYELLKNLFPDAVSESIDESGSPSYSLNIDALSSHFDNDVNEKIEYYELTWPGKSKAKIEAYTPTTKTLIPLEDKSINFNDTENVYIEGENLDALKILQESYLAKIKIIYIDPPYNTGDDRLYADDYSLSDEEYDELEGRVDEYGNRLYRNTRTAGRFHSNWCSMIYSRLILARNLMTRDGVIFISIGHEELANLTKICDGVFGDSNQVGIVSRLMKSGGGKGQYFSPNIEYIVIYAKDISALKPFREPLSEEIINKLYTSVETEGVRKGEKYRPFGLYQSSLDPMRGCKNQRYYIEAPDGTLLIPPGPSHPSDKCDGACIPPASAEDKVWRWSHERYLKERNEGNIEFKKSNGVLIDSNGNPAKWNVYTKMWLSDRQEEGMVPVDLITKWENRHSAKELQSLGIPFDFAKPSELIKYLIKLVDDNKDATILDFFSGSATTAHAVLSLNADDGGKRKFIMIQAPEECSAKSDAFKEGFKTICDIGETRITKVIKQLSNRLDSNSLDLGFRVLKVSDSIMKPVFYTTSSIKQTTLEDTVDNIKEEYRDKHLAILTSIMLDWGLSLSMPICIDKKYPNHTIFEVDRGTLVACFDRQIDLKFVEYIAKKKSTYAVFCDGSFDSPSSKINLGEIFKTISPNTVVKVI